MMSIRALGSVYAPLVSYTRSGGSPEDGSRWISRIATFSGPT